MKYFKKLVGENIYLSPMDIDDAQCYAKWFNDCYITDNLGATSILSSVQSEQQWIESNINNYAFSVITLKDDILIGNCSIMNINHIRQCAEIGLFIGEKSNHNKGYGTEMLKLLLNHSFNYLNLNNIMLRVFSFNDIAIHTYKKVGFKEMGHRRQSYYLNNKFYDEIYMDILKEEFLKNC